MEVSARRAVRVVAAGAAAVVVVVEAAVRVVRELRRGAAMRSLVVQRLRSKQLVLRWAVPSLKCSRRRRYKRP